MRGRMNRLIVLALLFPAAAQAADVSFNSRGDDLTGKVIEAMDRNVAAAAGRPVDFDVNLFAFTEPTIADHMLALAKANPNLHIQLVTDWSTLSDSAGHRPPYLERAATGDYAGACAVVGGTAAKKAACVANLQSMLGGQLLPNVGIHYKKDDPYTWDAAAHAAKYDHAKTQGLDHHKGIAFVVDGVPTELLTGSFNWSPTGNEDNFENLMDFRRDAPGERPLIREFAAEATAMYHNAAVSLSGPDVRAYRAWLVAKYAFDNGAGADPGPEPMPAHLGGGDEVIATCPLLAANPTLADLSRAVNGAVAVLGDVFKDDPAAAGDLVAVNSASKKELESLNGIGPVYAQKILDWEAAHGPMESKDDFKKAGLPAATIAKIASHVDLRYSEAFFSSHEMGCDRSGTGFAGMNATHSTLVRNATGDGVARVPSSLPAPVVDLFRRATPGQTIRVAAYGYSPSAPEYQELAAAVGRGVKAQVVLNDQYNESVVAALGTLAAAHPGMVEVKLSKTHVMHEKFGVVGDDVFNGSSNLNPSSTGRHAEDRFELKNDPSFAAAFNAEFDRLWSETTWAVGAPAA
jgi:hypothetical protein